MFDLPPKPEGLSEVYHSMALQAHGLMSGQSHPIANAANLAALIDQSLPNINWVGFYFLEPDPQGSDQPVLMVGPFQGKPACVRIEVGRGVCGTAVATREIQRVGDVHAFEGHIACDPDSKSELVVPLIRGGEVLGVLDIDSPTTHRFEADDEIGLGYLAEIYIRSLG